MSGRYLRKKKEGPRDPTMTHVDDPRLYRVGDYVRSYSGMHIIIRIDDDVFPDTRFAHMIETAITQRYIETQMPNPPPIHDFRPLDVENFYHNGWDQQGRPVSAKLTLEEAREVYERTLAQHMTGFVP